jgi:hypothetical protein
LGLLGPVLLAITAFCQRLQVLAETRPTEPQWETATSLSAPVSAVTKVFSHGDSGTIFQQKTACFRGNRASAQWTRDCYRVERARADRLGFAGRGGVGGD